MFLCIFRRKVLSLINFYLTLCTYKRILLFTLLNKIYLVSKLVYIKQKRKKMQTYRGMLISESLSFLSIMCSDVHVTGIMENTKQFEDNYFLPARIKVAITRISSTNRHLTKWLQLYFYWPITIWCFSDERNFVWPDERR